MADLIAPEFVWAPTRALGRAVLIVGLLVLIGALLGRLDLVALAAPFAMGTAWSLQRRPTHGPRLGLTLNEEVLAEGGSAGVAVTLANPNPVGLDVAVLRLSYSPWIRLRHGDRPYATDLTANEVTEVLLAGSAMRWGHHEVGPVQAYGVGCDGLLLSLSTTAPSQQFRVHPQMPVFRAEDAMPRSSALVGVHRSRRPGEGGELAGVRRYGSGDRLRRIDWRVTLRSRELHVAHTLSDRDAEVVVLLDVVSEAGRSGGIHGTASVLDTSVRAAAAIAEHYLRLGDRVGMLEYSGHPRQLRAGGGRQQLHQALEWLLSTRSVLGAGEPPAFGIDPHLVPSSALVVVLTPMLVPQSAQMIATLARAGRVVIAVDTLGDLGKQPMPATQWTQVAQRLWRLERENVIGSLREVGVPVVAWAGAGSLDQVLHDLVRMASAPRVVLR